jgi:dynein heavy chain
LITKIVMQCERNLPEGSSAVAYLKKLVFDFKEAMPIVEALNNAHLKEEHWSEIKEVMRLNQEYELERKQFSLRDLVNFDVADQADEVVNISTTATQENILEDQLETLLFRWQKLDFDVVKHQDKEAFKILNFEMIQNELDESMQISSSIVGSRYVKRLQSRANE